MYKHYPKWIYKTNQEPKIIQTKEELEQHTSDGWRESPQEALDVFTKKTVTKKRTTKKKVAPKKAVEE